MLKRALDMMFASLALLVLSPLMLVIAVLVRLRLGSPILFKQIRPGLGGKSFRIIKFRTMRDGDSDGRTLSDAERLTIFGLWLRSTSLDELPGLLNVMRGDMSLVGPRPLLMQYLPLYSSEQARRHEVRPGLTGWAQVNGRNQLSWKRKFDLDIWYVDHRSFTLDLWILCLTVQRVLGRTGISAEEEVTMFPFRGNDDL